MKALIVTSHFGKIHPNSMKPSGGDLFLILLRIRFSIGILVHLTFFAQRAAKRRPSSFLPFFATHTTLRLDIIIIVVIVTTCPRQKMPDSASKFRIKICIAHRGRIVHVVIGRPTLSFHLHRSGVLLPSTTVPWRHATCQASWRATAMHRIGEMNGR
jgi:hypothetical protein